ncbi:hypothetical protein [Anaerosinus massiliensis]|uniref:hypothetical protein n=1 Tax=Massilibacillus massiliensis TaxID=1806837 RepID=UPI000DA61D6D|nr:hypothetical protein [Massilibacillus massiliensis]
MSDTENQEVEITSTVDVDDFLLSNKKTTIDFRKALAHAVSETGKISKIIKMAFGNGGETDDQGNPEVPSDTGGLNNLLLTKDISIITYPSETSVCFECEIAAGELTANINEVALIGENDETFAKMRLYTSKGTDAESGLVFKWTLEF